LISAGGYMYACGGKDHNGVVLSKCERFCPSFGHWETMANMNVARGGASGAPLRGDIVVCGGQNSQDGSLASAEGLSVATGLWDALPSMRHPCIYSCAATLNRVLYVIGGRSFTGNRILESVNALSDFDESGSLAWLPMPPLSEPRYGAVAIALGASIFVCGGCLKTGHSANTIVQFHIPSGCWQPFTTMPVPALRIAGSAVAGKLIIFGGWAACGSAHIFDPRGSRSDNETLNELRWKELIVPSFGQVARMAAVTLNRNVESFL